MDNLRKQRILTKLAVRKQVTELTEEQVKRLMKDFIAKGKMTRGTTTQSSTTFGGKLQGRGVSDTPITSPKHSGKRHSRKSKSKTDQTEIQAVQDLSEGGRGTSNWMRRTSK